MSYVNHRPNMPFVPTGTYSGETFAQTEKSPFRLDLNRRLITHPEATFCMRVGTEGLRSLGIYKHDLLIIDRSKKPTHNSLVVFFREGEYGLNQLKLLPKDQTSLLIWGMVTYVIHKVADS